MFMPPSILIWYPSMGINTATESEHKNMDTNDTEQMHCPRACKERINIPRKQGDRGIIGTIDILPTGNSTL
jgi:hypothetical protein